MRVAAISDTHGRLDGWEVPRCDVLIHAGDLTAGGSYEESVLWLGYLLGKAKLASAKHLLIVPGNHDEAFEHRLDDLRAILAQYSGTAHILVDEDVEIGGKRFYGTPWTPTFNQWHFMGSEDELHQRFLAIPEELDVLITHGPARGILDPGFREKHAGSEALREAVEQRGNRIGRHVFGHLHGAGGQSYSRELGGTIFSNVAAVDEAYRVCRGALVFDI